jgi:hypothetical protein
LIFISLAAAFAADLNFNTIAIGIEPEDAYADCNIKFLEAVDQTLNRFDMSLITPVKNLENKLAVVRRALDLGLPLTLCHSSRSNYVDGRCKTSRLFLDALERIFPNKFLKPTTLLTELTTYDNYYVSATNTLYIRYHPHNTFKYPAALFSLLGQALFNQEGKVIVYSNDSWGHDLRAAYNLVERISGKLVPQQLSIFKTSNLMRVLHQPINCNSTWAQWGLKQAVAPLRRPRYQKTVACRVFQGYLAYVLHELGYDVECPAYRTGTLLETDPDARPWQTDPEVSE